MQSVKQMNCFYSCGETFLFVADNLLASALTCVSKDIDSCSHAYIC